MRRSWDLIMIVLLLIFVMNLENKIEAAEQYPVKHITFIVPLEAGSDGDIVSRKLAEKGSAILGKPFVIVNKPGAGSTIGYRELLNAKPDGYTIGLTTATIITNKLQGLMPYELS